MGQHHHHYPNDNPQMRRQSSLPLVHLGQPGELVLPQVWQRILEKPVGAEKLLNRTI